MKPIVVLEQFKHYSAKEKLLSLLILIYPAISVSVKSSGSVIFTLLALWALFSGWEKWSELRRDEKILLLAYVALFFLAAFTLIYTEDLSTGWDRVERFLRIACIFPIFLLLRKHPVDLARYFLIGIILAAFVVGAQAAYVIHILGEPRAHGAYYAIGFGGASVLNAALLVVALFSVCRANIERAIVVVAILAALYATIESRARGAWLFVPVFTVMMVALYWKLSAISLKWKVTGVALLLVAGIGVLQLSVVSERIDKAVDEIKTYDAELNKSYSSARARLKMWEASIYIWKENPILGTGVGDYGVDKNRLIETLNLENENLERFGHSHSIYFDALAGMGIIGFFLLIFTLILLPGYYFYQYWGGAETGDKKFVVLSGITVITAYAVFGLTESWLTRHNMLTPYVIYTVVFLAAMKNVSASES